MSKDNKKHVIVPETPFTVITGELWATLFQSGLFGVFLTILLYPYYLMFLPSWRAFVSSYFPQLDCDAVVFSLFLNGSHTFTYVLFNTFFALCDEFKWFQNYKLNRKDYMIPKRSLIISTILLATFSQVFVNPILSYYLFSKFTYLGMKRLDDPLPSLLNLFLCYSFAYQANSTINYFTHRIFHHKLFYSAFHKQHHEYTGTIGITTEHATFVENFISNLIPTLFGCVFYGTHPICFGIWLFIRLWHTYEQHSGYCFKDSWLDRVGLAHWKETCLHDFHHSVNTGNYGGSDFLDYFLGTLGESYSKEGMAEGYIHKKFPNKKE